MLKRFEVENFKGFQNKLIFDLEAREYPFNESLVVNGIVNKALIYGKNGIGKSTLGIALFDIVGHLTDKEKMSSMYLINYINLNSNRPNARFRYCFQFDENEVIYEYEKNDPHNLVYEKIWIDGRVVLDYSYSGSSSKYIDESLCGSLNIALTDNKLSVVKYIYRNTPTNYHPLLTRMMQFCENMLWYRCLSEGNSYCGFFNGVASLDEQLYETGKIGEFEKFLNDNELHYKLQYAPYNGQHRLMAVFDEGRKSVPFWSIASTGTLALFLYFVWSSTSFNRISFLFIDEFDAFLHYEAAANIIRSLNRETSFQSVLTSHNTYLMQNRLTRPDCCFNMTENKIQSLDKSTEKELKEIHNLEKIFINGGFNG